eukprot:COSAG04_NODE_2618_length_3845_cov_7.274693_3_plen_266_part_00
MVPVWWAARCLAIVKRTDLEEAIAAARSQQRKNDMRENDADDADKARLRQTRERREAQLGDARNRAGYHRDPGYHRDIALFILVGGIFGGIALVVVYHETCWGHAPDTRLSDYAEAYTLSGCDDPTHCGTFLPIDSTCDCGAPVYQLPSADGDGVVLYRYFEDIWPSCVFCSPPHRSYWVVSSLRDYESDSYSDCTLESSGWWPEGGPHMRSSRTGEPGVPTSSSRFEIAPSDGSDLCAGVDCGTGEIQMRQRFSMRTTLTLACT